MIFFLCFSSPFIFSSILKGNRIPIGGYARTEVPAGELPPDGVPYTGVPCSWAAGAEVDPPDPRDARGYEGGESVVGGVHVLEACAWARQAEPQGEVFQSGSTGWCWGEDEETTRD